MELYREVLLKVLEEKAIQDVIPVWDMTLPEKVEGECCKALEKIKAVVADDSLSDPECFFRIEKIVCALEEAGSNGGGRHDFG